MSTSPITVVPDSVTDEPIPAHSRKRQFAATAVAGTLTVILGLAATGAINRIGEIVKARIAPEPEKTENE